MNKLLEEKLQLEGLISGLMIGNQPYQAHLKELLDVIEAIKIAERK